MSTKIYNGYQLIDAITPFDVIERFRPLAQEAKQRLAISEVANDVAGAFCRHWIQQNTPEARFGANDLVELETQNQIGFRRGSGQGTVFVDPYYANLSFRRHQGKTYLILSTHNAAPYGTILDRMDGLNDYSYWNDTNRPDDVSDEAWAERRRTWFAAIEEPELRFELHAEGRDDSLHKVTTEQVVDYVQGKDLINPLTLALGIEVFGIRRRASDNAGEGLNFGDVFLAQSDPRVREIAAELIPQLPDLTIQSISLPLTWTGTDPTALYRDRLTEIAATLH